MKDEHEAARNAIFDRHTIPAIVTILRRPTDVLRLQGRVERWRVDGAARTMLDARDVDMSEVQDKHHVALRRPGAYVELSVDFSV